MKLFNATGLLSALFFALLICGCAKKKSTDDATAEAPKTESYDEEMDPDDDDEEMGVPLKEDIQPEPEEVDDEEDSSGEDDEG